ncbi:hypothetical protein NQD34_018307 [Periophthalmus magnuspinnatus]|nr:hypothetical protein NQD34_018307 [Periophthalmus magnuspinnatus]
MGTATIRLTLDQYASVITRVLSSTMARRCELSRWGPGFYGALFGALAAALLLLSIIIIAVVVYRRQRHGIWTRRDSLDRRLSTFEEDFFDYRGDHYLRFHHT